MEQRKDLTKSLIAESFKELMLKYPFEKITIKMITDHCGIIRPTFYNHFCDKYELVEWIFVEEVINKVDVLIDEGMFKESVKLFFSCIAKNTKFYKKCFEITGQNGFEEIMNHHVHTCFKKVVEKTPSLNIDSKVLTTDSIALFYSLGLVTAIKVWISEPHSDDITVEDVSNAYFYILSNPLFRK